MREERKITGFSLVEVVVVVAVIGVVASLSCVVLGNIGQSVKDEKLNSDARTLNRAVMAYLSAGGSLDEADSAEKVLAKLRTAASATVSKRLPGLSASFMDPRVSLRMQDEKEAVSGDARVYWNSKNQRFELSFAGDSAGIKEFYLDDRVSGNSGETDERSFALVYSENPGWIWDFQDRPFPRPPPGPTVVSTDPDAGGGSLPGSDPVDPKTPLTPPAFTFEGGEYSIKDFDLPIGLTDPNPSGLSELYYSINYGDWELYTGVFATAPGTTVSAQAVPIDSAYSSSAKVNERFDAIPAQLESPVITASADSFGVFFDKVIWVDLIDANEQGIAMLQYRLNSGPWLAYQSRLTLDRDLYPGGVLIEGRALPAGSPYYLESTISIRSLTMETLELSSSATGGFHDPLGPTGMVTNLPPGASSSHFEWGDDDYPWYNLSKSTMDFAGDSVISAAGGERFQIGTLDYYNGKVLGGTGADSVELDLALNLDINGNLYNPVFGFTFELINTVNLGDPYNPWRDADYVRLDDPSASQTLTVNGYEFEFRIEFGESSSDGFAYFDEFHVLEERDASVSVYGTFVQIGPVATEPSSPDGGIEGSGDSVSVNPGEESTVPAGSIDWGESSETGEEVSLPVNLAPLAAAEAAAEAASEEAEAAAAGAEEAAIGAANCYILTVSETDANKAVNYASQARTYADEAVAKADLAEAAAVDASAASVVVVNESSAITFDSQDVSYLRIVEDLAVEAEEAAIEAEDDALVARSFASDADAYATKAVEHVVDKAGQPVMVGQ